MVQIAEHHRPDHWSHGLHGPANEYVPAKPWPEKCTVQWGASGVVISRKGNYRTAFFEAFPGDNAGGFIRGEGRTIADAEADAFAAWEQEVACDHRFGRKGYTNGGALCHKCGAFKTLFQPIYDMDGWRKPLSALEILNLRLFEGSKSTYVRKLLLRRKLFGPT